MTLIEIIIIATIILYFSYIIFESFYAKWLRKHFKYVIHINGIRGKSTTTRLIDAGLRECGYKVFSKTTGTIPTYIDTNNKENRIFRLNGANIKEQIKMMRLAKKEGTEILVLECMAVNPLIQELSEKLILKSDITVITNVREDHIKEMGDNKDDIAKAFSTTIPTNGTLIIGDSEYKNFFIKEAKKKNTMTYVSKEYKGDTFDTFSENISLALEVATTLNLDKDLFLNGLKKYHKDYGAYEEFIYDDHILLNGFSINDPESIKLVYDEIIKRYDKSDLTILLNSLHHILYPSSPT